MLFICDEWKTLGFHKVSDLPLGIRFLFIDAFVSHPNLELTSAVESRALGSKKQLNITCKIKSRSRNVQLVESLYIAKQVHAFGGEGYERLGISFDCGASIMASLFLNGERFHLALRNNETLEECISELIEADLLWFKSSTLSQKLYSLSSSAASVWDITKLEIINQWQQQGWEMPSTKYSIRDIRNKSVESLRRLEAYVVVRRLHQLTDQQLHDIVRNVVSRLRRHRIRNMGIGVEEGFSLPPDYVWIMLFQEDKRIRKLMYPGLQDSALVLKAEWISSRNNKGPIFVEQPHLLIDDIRVQYSSAFILYR